MQNIGALPCDHIVDYYPQEQEAAGCLGQGGIINWLKSCYKYYANMWNHQLAEILLQVLCKYVEWDATVAPQHLIVWHNTFITNPIVCGPHGSSILGTVLILAQQHFNMLMPRANCCFFCGKLASTRNLLLVLWIISLAVAFHLIHMQQYGNNISFNTPVLPCSVASFFYWCYKSMITSCMDQQKQSTFGQQSILPISNHTCNGSNNIPAGPPAMNQVLVGATEAIVKHPLFWAWADEMLLPNHHCQHGHPLCYSSED